MALLNKGLVIFKIVSCFQIPSYRFQDKHVKCVRDIFDDKKERSINYLRRETGSISATSGSERITRFGNGLDGFD